MKNSMQISLTETGGLLVLLVILFKNLQPFEKTIAMVCLGYCILLFRIQFFRGFIFMAKMLTKACLCIFKYEYAFIFNFNKK